MFADKAYSQHGVLLMVAVILCVVSCSVLLAYAGEKLYRKPLFWISAMVLLLSTGFVVLRYLLLIAPVQPIAEIVSDVQIITGIGSGSASLILLVTLIIQKYQAGLIFVLSFISLLNLAGIGVVLRSNPLSIADLYPAAGYLAFLGFFIWSSKKLFPELSVRKSEVFLKGSTDLIFVFDNSGKLLKASFELPETLCCREGMTRDEFDSTLREAATVIDDKTVIIDTACGKKYYQTSETLVKAWGGVLRAVVLILFDVTELMELKAQLNEKNEELDIRNVQLEAALRNSERLESEMHKEKIIRELELIIGHKIDDMTRRMECVESKQNLSDLIKTCRGIMEDVRFVVSRLLKGEGENIRDDKDSNC